MKTNVREKWRNQQQGGKAWGLSGAGSGVQGEWGAGRAQQCWGSPMPQPPALLREHVFGGGRASLPTAAAAGGPGGEPYATAIAAARSSSPVLQVSPVNPSLCIVVAGFGVCDSPELQAPAACHLTDHCGFLSPCL